MNDLKKHDILIGDFRLIYTTQQIKHKEMIQDMLSVQEHLAGRRLDPAISKTSPGTRFASYSTDITGSSCCQDGKEPVKRGIGAWPL